MKQRDDMKIFSYEYKGKEYIYSIPDTCFDTRDGGEHYNFCVNVRSKTGDSKDFQVPFRLSADSLHMAQSAVEEGIRKFAEAK